MANIFISYVKEDVSEVRSIFQFLKDNGHSVWMDESSLLPGQNWQLKINELIKSCDFFIACMSKRSVTKKGFFQKELKAALDVFAEYPEGKSFFIPLKLEQCHLPESLSAIQWLDWFSPDSKKKLLDAIAPICGKENDSYPIRVITEGSRRNYLYFTISNYIDSEELRVSQIEADVLYCEATSVMGIVNRFQTKGLILPDRQTELLRYDEILSLKPKEALSFSTEVHVKENFYDYIVFFRLKIKFFRIGAKVLSNFYSNEFYCFTANGLKVYTTDELLDVLELKNIPNDRLINDDGVKKIRAAAAVLSETKNFRATKLLIALIKQNNPHVQKAAINALGRLGDCTAFKTLLSVLMKKDNNRDIRSASASALTNTVNPDEIDTLISMLMDDDVLVQEAASEALGKIKNVDIIEPLTSVLMDKNRDPRVKVQAARALVKVADPSTVEVFIAILTEKDEDFRVQTVAAYALGEIGDSRAINTLSTILKDYTGNYREVQCETALALGKLNDPLGKKFLINELSSDRLSHTMYMEKVIKAIGVLSDPQSIQPLLDFLIRHHGFHGEYIVEAIKRIGISAAINNLIDMLEIEDESFRRTVVRILCQLGDSRAVEPLIRLLNKEHTDYFRKEIEEALMKLSEKCYSYEYNSIVKKIYG